VASVYDVAKLAEVSAATASRVLSGSTYPVREATRQRVLRAAAELDFQPNRLARALVTARTNTLGAIVHDIADPYFAEIARGLEDAARADGYQVFVCSSDRDAERELAYVRSLLAYRVDALVLTGGGIEDRAYRAELERLLGGLRERGGQAVMLAPQRVRGPSVLPDNQGGAALMTRHLLALGHRRIGLVGGPRHIRTSAVRLAGHRAALAEAGVDFDASLLAPGDFTVAGGAHAAAELLARHPDVTALFAANDVMAFGVLGELRERSIAVPADVSVAGFDDVAMAAHVSVPLTTVRVPMYRLGWEGAKLALGYLAGRRPRSRVLATEVVERASTGPPRPR
jgi:LacI family transcriptional regulator